MERIRILLFVLPFFLAGCENPLGSGSVFTPGANAETENPEAPSGPQLSSVSVPADGIYVDGDNLDFILNYDAAVTVTGSPQIALTLGGETVQAVYVGGSGTPSLTFRRALQTDDFDMDGMEVAASIDVNGGTLVGGNGEAAEVSLGSVDGSGVLVTESGLTLWLDANASSTLFQTAGCTTAANPGDALGCWQDRSGAGNHAITLVASEPTVQSGKVDFVGAGDTTATGNCMTLPSVSGQTVIGVFTSTGGNGGIQAVLGQPYAGGNSVYLFLSTDGWSAYTMSFDGTQSEEGRFGLDGADFNAFNMNVGTGDFPSDAIAVMEYQNPQTDWVSLGCMSNSSGDNRYRATYGLSELLVFSGTVSDPTMKNKIEGYLACKWGTQARLPGGHPYKTNCP